MANGDEPPPWKWTETAEFAGYCYAVLPGEDVSAVDTLRWAIHDNVLFNPDEAPYLHEQGHPDYDPAIRYLTVLDSAHWAFPPTFVVFRIDSFPEDEDTPGEVTGLAAWTIDHARKVGLAP